MTEDIEGFLEGTHKGLKKFLHVLNVLPGTKIVDGVNTGEPCITFLVDEKAEESKLSELPGGYFSNVIPKTIGGFKTDVVELKPTTWVAGKTSVSELSPKQQRRLLGALKEHRPEGRSTAQAVADALYEVDWEAAGKCTPVEDQKSCGSCCAFGSEQAWQDDILVREGVTLALSPQHLFFCSDGSCEGGNTVEATLAFCVDNGVALSEDCPYVSGNGIDRSCGYGLASDWYLRGKILATWARMTDKTQMKEALSVKPLVTTMTVYNDFFNYVSGIYTPTVPDIAGGHCIETVGCSDSRTCWKSKNSWGTGWGMAGYFLIAQGVSNFDDEMYVLTLSDAPIPPPPNPPGPTPSPCPFSMAVVKLPGGRLFLRHYRSIRKDLFGIEPGAYPEA